MSAGGSSHQDSQGNQRLEEALRERPAVGLAGPPHEQVNTELTGAPRSRARLLAVGLMCAAVVYAPLAFGCTTPATRLLLDAFLVGAALIFAVDLAVRKKRWRGARPAIMIVAGLGILGLLAVMNPRFVFEEESWSFSPLHRSVPFLPGTIDGHTSLPVLLHLGALGVGFVVLLDLVQDRRNCLLLLKAVALSGFAVALAGITQKATQSHSMLWVDELRGAPTFFAAFRYHGNAAAFLNLCWPASLALLLRSIENEETVFLRGLWANSLIFTLIGVFANTSKAGHVLAVVGIPICWFLFRRALPRGRMSGIGLIVAGLLVVAMIIIAVAPGAGLTIDRWREALEGAGSLRGRLTAYGACLRMVPDASAFGFGPGSFGLAFPFYTQHLGDQIKGIWSHAHQDYLQTVIEWGFVGGALWFFLIGWGLIQGWRRAVAQRGRTNSGVVGVIALTLLCAHALIDFPFQIASLQLYATIYLAILWRPARPSERPSRWANVSARA